jgi:hypothetical protein
VDSYVRLLGYCFRFGGTARGQDGLVYGTKCLGELRDAHERVLGGWMKRGGKSKRRKGERCKGMTLRAEEREKGWRENW